MVQHDRTICYMLHHCLDTSHKCCVAIALDQMVHNHLPRFYFGRVCFAFSFQFLGVFLLIKFVVLDGRLLYSFDSVLVWKVLHKLVIMQLLNSLVLLPCFFVKNCFLFHLVESAITTVFLLIFYFLSMFQGLFELTL